MFLAKKNVDRKEESVEMKMEKHGSISILKVGDRIMLGKFYSNENLWCMGKVDSALLDIFQQKYDLQAS